MSMSYEAGMPVDSEFIEDWTFLAKFQTGKIATAAFSGMMQRDADSREGQQTFVILNQGDIGVTSFLTNDSVHGTQQEVIQKITRRFKFTLGGLAVPSNVISVHMNVEQVATELLRPFGVNRYPLLPEELETLEPMTKEEWDLMLEAPDPHTIDVTEHVKELLTYGI